MEVSIGYRAAGKNTRIGERKMEAFTFSYPTKNYFGQGAARKALAEELPKYGKHVLLAYGGGSVKRNGIYDEVLAILKEQGKEVTEFAGIMSNPTYRKVQEGARLVREHRIVKMCCVKVRKSSFRSIKKNAATKALR